MNDALEVTRIHGFSPHPSALSSPNMTLIPAWALLGLSFFGCLVLGNTNQGTAGEGTQLERRILFLKPGKSMENIRNKTRSMPKFYNFPLVNKTGVLHYDLAGVNETKLEISANNHSVKGITASSGECRVRSLMLGSDYLLDEQLLTHCQPLNLTLQGKKWKCLQMGRLLQHREIIVDMTSADCSDAWMVIKEDTTHKYNMMEGILKFQEFAISSDLTERCRCSWYFGKDFYTVNVDCDDLGLTDDMLLGLPPLPENVTRISFENNRLSSMDTLIQYLQPSSQVLKTLNLNNNQMRSLPGIQESFPKLIDISLVNNKLETIDLEAYEDLISRESVSVSSEGASFIETASLSIEGNPFPCDCNMYFLKDIIHQRCRRGWKLCTHNLKEITCKKPHNKEPVPIFLLRGEGCVTTIDWWIMLNVSLGMLNSFMIYLIVDLIIVLTGMGGKKERRPKIDYVVCALKSILCSSGRGKRVGTGRID